MSDPNVDDYINQSVKSGIPQDILLEELNNTYFGIDAKKKSSAVNNDVEVNNVEISKISEAIGHFESGGNYNARGPMVTSGKYTGERALGKYQIMPGNLPQWSKEALGKIVSAQEFLASPKIQDAISQYQFGKLYQKYGNIRDVASVWFTGGPESQGKDKKDVIGTTGKKYIDSVEAIYNKFG